MNCEIGTRVRADMIDDFIGDNDRISIISNGGERTRIPVAWRPILDSCDAIVAIPDMHLYHYCSPLDGFRCGAEAMVSFLGHLERVRREWRLSNRRLRILQLGDLYELWFPHPETGRALTPEDIWTSHPLYEEIHRLFRILDVEFICGNHDYRNLDGTDVRISAREGRVYSEHGFAADPWYRFSNPNRTLWRPAMTALKTVRRIESIVHGTRGREDDPRLFRSRAWGVGSGERERADFTQPGEYRLHSLAYYSRLFEKLRGHCPTVRLCLVGHTHMPFIDTNFIDGQGIYVDAGAWSYGRSDFAVVTNEAAAICHYARSAGEATTYRYRIAG